MAVSLGVFAGVLSGEGSGHIAPRTSAGISGGR